MARSAVYLVAGNRPKSYNWELQTVSPPVPPNDISVPNPVWLANMVTRWGLSEKFGFRWQYGSENDESPRPWGRYRWATINCVLSPETAASVN